MEDHFERLPENCLAIIFHKVKEDTPQEYRSIIRPVCKRFLEHVRAHATKLTLDDPHACSGVLERGFPFRARYRGLESLDIDTRCFGFASTVGLGGVSWKQIRIVQEAELADEGLQGGCFLLAGSRQSLRQLEFEVGSKTCDHGVAEAAWKEIEEYLGLLGEGPLELSVRNLLMFFHEELAGARAVHTLKLDMACELFSVAIPHSFPNLKRLIIIDRDDDDEKGGEESWAAVLGEGNNGPWPEMGRLEELSYTAEHHQWAADGELAEQTFQCVATQAPNLVRAQFLGMLHEEVVGGVLGKIVASLCSLEELEELTMEIVGGENLVDSNFHELVPLFRKRSLKKLVVCGLSETQARLLKVEKKQGLRFERVV